MFIGEGAKFGATGLLVLALSAGYAAQPVWAGFSQDFGLVDIFPDLFTSDLALDYDYDDVDFTSVLTIQSTGSTTGGWRETATSGSFPFESLSFSLTASFADNGSSLTGGSVSIVNTGVGGGASGFPPGGNFLGIPTDAVLLDADIFDFAVDPAAGAESMFFKLRNTQSEAAVELGWDVPQDGQIIFRFDTLSSSDWALGNLDFTGEGASDTFVPSPATVALIGIGLIGLQWLRVRNRPRRTPPAAAGDLADARSARP